MPGLSPKQRRFVEEYLVDLNATQAATRAGYSAKTAKQQGQRLLTNADIQAAVSAGQNKRSQRTALTQDIVLAGLRKEAEREDESASHGARVSAWTALGKHLGLFPTKVEMAGPEGGPIVLEIVRFADVSS